MQSPLPAPRSRDLPYGALVGIVAVLFFAKEVLIPLALAVLFSFLLAPVVRRLERRGVWRALAVLSVTAAFFSIFGLIGWVTGMQLVDLAGKLPQYQNNIQRKLETVRGQGGSLTKAAKVIENIETASDSGPRGESSAKGGAPSLPLHIGKITGEDKPPVPVQIVEPPASPPQFLRTMFGPLLAPAATAFIVVIFTIFILLQREDLRDRLLHLAGPERLPVTTQAIDEAGVRVSRYLQMQVAVNVTFGIGIGAGLYFIGVPAALLWGLLATCFRFVPYLGVWVGAAGPLILATAAFQSWQPVVMTAGLFFVLELLTGNAIEPWLYGTSTGLSPVAVVVAASFWTWLWGGMGLLLSMPLTVCIVVLGRYVPQLAFLHTLLGDEPVLPPDGRLYQRLLALDQEEVTGLVDEYLAEHPVADFYDAVLIPTLNQAQTDAQHGNLGEDRQQFVLQTIHTLVGELQERSPETLAPVSEENDETTEQAGGSSAAPRPVRRELEAVSARLLIVPVKTEADELAGQMLAHLFSLGAVNSRVLSYKALANETLEIVAADKVDVVCLSAVRPFAVLQARYLAKRLRARFPGLKILIGLWDSKRPAVGSHRNLQSTPADWIVETLAGAVTKVCPTLQCLPCAALEVEIEGAGKKEILPMVEAAT